MKDAYSNLASQYIEPHQVDHADMAEFQIVCPCCREPVYKSVRTHALGETGYFSHYRSAAEFASDCERRVLGISSGEKERANSEGRNQSLSVFRAVLRDAVALIPIDGKPYDEKAYSEVSFMFGSFALEIGDLVKDFVATNSLNRLVEENDRRIAATKYENLTTFGDSYRRQIAADLVRTLFAQNSTKTITHMIGRAVAHTYEITGKSPDGYVKMATRNRATKLMQDPRLAELGQSDNKNQRLVIGAYIVLDAMLRELHRLPYLKMLFNAKQKRPVLSGISVDDYLPDLEDGKSEFEDPGPVPRRANW